MTRETAFEALEILSCCDQPLEIIFFGGEPLLELPLMRDMVSYARTLEEAGRGPFSFGFPTNGTLLTDKVIDFCRAEHIAVTLSMDGDEGASSGRITAGGNGSFRRVRKALADLRDAGLAFDVKMTVTPENAGAFSRSVSFLIEEGARIIDWSPALNLPWRRVDLAQYRKELFRTARQYVKHLRSPSPVELVELEADMSALGRGRAFGSGLCGAGTSYLAVGAGGEIYPCHAFFSGTRYVMGNLKEGISDKSFIFFNKLSSAHMRGCEPCGLGNVCRRCLAVNALAGSVLVVPGRSCSAAKIGLEVAGRALKEIAPGLGGENGGPAGERAKKGGNTGGRRDRADQ
jgi:uncharacterized protein